MLQIKVANIEDYIIIRDFYYSLIDTMEDAEFKPGWEKVIELARENDIKTIRLDVLEGNVPAERVYTRMGFEYLDTIQMFYEDTGWTDFKVFEFIV